MQQIAGKLVKGRCPSQLLSGLFRGRVGGHMEMDNATPVMGQYHQHARHSACVG